MPQIELIYDADCPNVEAARSLLRRALEQDGQPADWQEWDRADPAAPVHVRQYGSPTILVDGRDVAGTSPSDGADCCRVYRCPDGVLHGVPDIGAVAASLRGGAALTRVRNGWRSSLLVIPATGVAMLPSLACPACWPAYAGLLSSVGLGALTQSTYLLPLTAACLIVAVGALALGARNRHGYGPFVMGVVAAALVIVGKFALASDPVLYAGIALLIGTSIWNTWPKQKTTSCPACTGEERIT